MQKVLVCREAINKFIRDILHSSHLGCVVQKYISFCLLTMLRGSEIFKASKVALFSTIYAIRNYFAP